MSTATLLVILAVASTAVGSPDAMNSCSSLEQYNACGVSPGCVQTCDNLSVGLVCAAVCVPGCFCVENHVREHANGPCIPITDCPSYPRTNG
ncbi:chymotrypsin inhibitor Ani s 6-like [Athalia rosae]|uniref:chymotrypsin inhibitor Ani s 6-like n=1 Tax=Athalia rosae TaxID=37344 RepID=UPI0006254D2F|nr:chymotrypsin inhibitor Ani s 6-like [Athalia rosae]